MSLNDFSISALITPSRLKAPDRDGAFACLPAWAASGIFPGDDPEDTKGLEVELDVFVVHIPGVSPLTIELPAISAAVLFELTRYGNSVAANSNKTGGEVYAKLTFAQHAKDNTPITRIVAGARARQAVRQTGKPGDYRPENLETLSHGKPEKDARVVALKHAVELAHNLKADVPAYEGNLLALIERHDEVLYGRSAY